MRCGKHIRRIRRAQENFFLPVRLLILKIRPLGACRKFTVGREQARSLLTQYEGSEGPELYAPLHLEEAASLSSLAF